MMESAKGCSLQNVKFQCSNDEKFKTVSDFTPRQVFLIQQRSGHNDQIASVCLNHERQLLIFYEQKQTSCCDPLNRHKNLIKTSLLTVSEEFEDDYHEKYPVILEGKKICSNCRKLIRTKDDTNTDCDKVSTHMSSFFVISGTFYHLLYIVYIFLCLCIFYFFQPSNAVQSENSDLSNTQGSSQSSAGYCTPPEMLLERINSSLKMINIEPVSRSQLTNKSYRARKVSEIVFIYESSFNKILDIETSDQMIGSFTILYFSQKRFCFFFSFFFSKNNIYKKNTNLFFRCFSKIKR